MAQCSLLSSRVVHIYLANFQLPMAVIVKLFFKSFFNFFKISYEESQNV